MRLPLVLIDCQERIGEAPYKPRGHSHADGQCVARIERADLTTKDDRGVIAGGVITTLFVERFLRTPTIVVVLIMNSAGSNTRFGNLSKTMLKLRMIATSKMRQES
jgi:hypothetical protein